MEGIYNIFIFLQYLPFFRALRNLVNTKLEFQSWNSVHEERAALCGTAGQQEKGKFLLLPPASKANWQHFVISAGRIPSVGLNNNLRVGFNSILFKSYCTLLNCFCFVVNETKSSLCKGKIVEQQSWNLHVKSFLFLLFSLPSNPSFGLVLFSPTELLCPAGDITGLAVSCQGILRENSSGSCPERLCMGRTSPAHTCMGQSLPAPALQQPGHFCKLPKGSLSQDICKTHQNSSFFPILSMDLLQLPQQPTVRKAGTEPNNATMALLGSFFLGFFFPVIFFSES